MAIPFIGLILAVLGAGIAALVVLNDKRSRLVGAAASGIALLLVLCILAQSLSSGRINIAETYSYYLPSLNIPILFHLTPISFALVLMAAIVAFVTILSGNIEREAERTSIALSLLLELAAIGLFASGNLLLFFIFWDVGVIALFFMIYSLGSPNRRRAAMKFIVYELFASLFLLFAIMIIYFYTPVHSLDIQYIIANAASIPQGTQELVFLFLFIAFLTNMPVFPLHLWLPDAHTEASTQGSMLLSGVLTKFGGYGMLLLFSMLPIASQYSQYIAILAGFSAIYAAFALMGQHDLKRIIAYTTIVEMSIILLGISAINQFGTYGAAYAMVAHGFTISLLFLCAGAIGFSFGTRDLRVLRGLVSSSLSTSYSFLVGVFATTGVPLTAAFIGDILIFIGAVQAFSAYAAIPLASLLILGGFLYFIMSKSMFATKEESRSVGSIGTSQGIGYAILLSCIFIFGIFPFILLNFFNL